MAVYSNLSKVKKLTNSSLTSILDITNINFNNLSIAITSLLDSIQYDETLNTMSLSSIDLQSAVITSSLLVKQNGITKISIDNAGRIEGSSMLFEVTETQRQRFISYPDYPATGVNGEVIFTGDDIIAWFDDRGWTSLTLTENTIGGDFYLPDIQEDSANDFDYFLVIDPTSGGIVKYTTQVVRTISGNIVDNSDAGNPVIDQVQADWTQEDGSAVDFVRNKPEVLWQRGVGVDSLEPVYTTSAELRAQAFSTNAIAVGSATVASSDFSFSSGSQSVAGLTLSATSGDFEWHSPNTIRISSQTFAVSDLNSILNALVIGQNIGVWNNISKSYVFYTIHDIIFGNGAGYIVMDPALHLGISPDEYSNILILPDLYLIDCTTASGKSSIASGQTATAEGSSMAFGDRSHSENNSIAIGERSHAEGNATSLGVGSHAEGNAISVGKYSHAGGTDSIAGGTVDFDAVSISRRVIVKPGLVASEYPTGYPFVYAQVGGSLYNSGMPNVLVNSVNIRKSYQSSGEVSTDAIASTHLLTTRIFRTTFGSEASIYRVVPLRGGTLFAVCGNFFETGFGVGSFVQEYVSQGFIILREDGTVLQDFPNGVDLASGEEIKDCLELPDSSILVAGQFVNFNASNVSKNIQKLDWTGSSYSTNTGWGITMDNGSSPTAPAVNKISRNINGWIIAVGKFARTNELDTSHIVAITENTAEVVTSFAAHIDSVPNTVLCDGPTTYIGGVSNFGVAADAAFTIPVPVNGIVAVDSVTGEVQNTLQSIDGEVLQIIKYDAANNQLLACGSFTEVADVNATYTIGGIFKFYVNLEIDEKFTIGAGTGANNTILGITVQENGKILVSGEFNEYDGTPSYNTIRLFEDGSFDADLLAIDYTASTGILELSGKSLLVYGKISTIDGVNAYGGMALMPANGGEETTIILDTEIDHEIDGIRYAQIRLEDLPPRSRFAHGTNAAALGADSVALGYDVTASAQNSTVTGTGAAAYLRGSSVFSSGYTTVHGDTQSLVFTQGLVSPIFSVGVEYSLDGPAGPNISLIDPLKADALYRTWSVTYNAIVTIVDGGLSNASSGKMQAFTGHFMVSYSGDDNLISITDLGVTLSSIGTLDNEVSGLGRISPVAVGPSEIRMQYINLGLDGGGDGELKIAATFTITESCIF